jgi:hypothetical protein
MISGILGKMSTPVDIQTPILFCLGKRSRYVKGIKDWEWVAHDPVVSSLAAALYILDREGGITLTEKIRQKMESYYWKNIARWLVREDYLKKVIGALRQENVQVILLKGAAFQETLYKNVGLRSMADIDILVQPDEFLLAIKILQQCGFRASSQDISRTIARLEKLPKSYWPKDLSFINHYGMVIELHQNLIIPWFLLAFPLDIDAIWDRSTSIAKMNVDPAIQAENSNVRILSPYDTLAHLCLNLALHGLKNLQSYLDIDLWIRNLTDSWDWDKFLERVFQWRIRSVAYHILSICKYLFDTPLPDNILQRLNPGTLARWRVTVLISANSILADHPSLGRRFPTLVKLALIDSIPLIWVTFKRLVFPGKAWREHNPYGRSLIAHWLHVSHVVNRGG